MGQYIGARYVPRFMGTYDATQVYEALDVVDNGLGTSYIAKIPTPANIPLTNTTYWAVYGATSGAIINLQNQIDTINNTDIPGLQNQIDTINNTDIPALESVIESSSFIQTNEHTNAIFFGDSITAGDLGNGTIANPTFPQAYASISGLTPTNMGRGGSTAANNPNAGSAEHLNYVASLVNFANYDQCFICHGVNDYNADSPLGGINSTDEGTFMGALQKFIETAYTQNPSIQIVMLGTFWSIHAHTTLHGAAADYLPTNNVGFTIADYINGARSVANKYNIPFIDMMDMLGINLKNHSTFLADGIHPKQSTYTLIGIELAKSMMFAPSYGYEQVTAVEKTRNNSFIAIGDIPQYVGDFPVRYLKKGITTLFNADHSYYAGTKQYPFFSGEPYTFHAIVYVKPKSNFYFRMTDTSDNHIVLWEYQNNGNADEYFEVNRTICSTFTGYFVIEAKIDSLDGTLDTEAVYLTDLTVSRGTIPDRGGVGADPKEFTWFTPTLNSTISAVTGNPPQFMVDRMGNVSMRGRITIDPLTLSGNRLFTLPTYLIPERTMDFIICEAETSNARIFTVTVNSSNGNISIRGSIASTVTIDISSIHFNINKNSDITSPY